MSFITAFVTGKVVAGLVAGGTLAAGGTVAAAYTGNLPAPLQQAAHDVIGAPAAAAPSKAQQDKSGDSGPGDTKDSQGEAKPTETPRPHPSGHPTGPDATGPAAFGLCTAFLNGGLDSASTAYKSLAAAAAAKGSQDVTAYCKTVPGPGKSGQAKSDNQSRPDDAKSGSRGKSEEHKKDDNSEDSESPDATPKATPPGQSNRGLSHKPAEPEAS